MPTKLKIKMGHIEFEYEGDAAFDKDAIKDLFTHMESLVGATPAAAFDNSAGPGGAPASSAGEGAQYANDASPQQNLAMNTVAARLGVKSASDLAIAAAAHIQLVVGNKSFNRKDLLETMQETTTYYNNNMSSNLTKSLSSLISNKRINELTNNQMSLSANEINGIKVKLAE